MKGRLRTGPTSTRIRIRSSKKLGLVLGLRVRSRCLELRETETTRSISIKETETLFQHEGATTISAIGAKVRIGDLRTPDMVCYGLTAHVSWTASRPPSRRHAIQGPASWRRYIVF